MNLENNEEPMFSNSYIAGLIDSDGNIYLDYHKTKNKGFNPLIRVSISQKHPILLFNLKNQLKYGAVYKIKNQNCWVYEINSNGAVDLLHKVSQYLKNKSSQANQAIYLYELGNVSSISDITLYKKSITELRFSGNPGDTIDLEWFSGYFDGDGYIGISKSNNCNSARVRMTITIDKRDKHIAEYMKKHLGGNIYKSSDNIRWDLNVNKIELLDKLSIYSKLKKAQIDKCIEFLKLKKPTSSIILSYIRDVKEMKQIDNQDIKGDIDINDYQKWSRELVKYDTKNNMGIYYTCLGLGEETGEVCGVISKIIRDNNHKIEGIHKEKLLKELGDVLFYLARLADELNIDLKSILTNNIKKLEGRLERNVIHGSGSDR